MEQSISSPSLQHNAQAANVPAKHKYTVGQDPARIDEVLAQNRRFATPFMLAKCERDAARNWDIFYKNNGDRFFKNKNWTEREFAEELPNGVAQSGNECASASENAPDVAMVAQELTRTNQPTVLLEVGCGPGNMLYPVLNRNSAIKAHCCDFSKRAIDMIQLHPSFDAQRINPFVADLVKDGSSLGQRCAEHVFGRPTVISLIFVLSAVPPQHHREVLANLLECLPQEQGGTLLFRDFGHGDLAQLRFHQKASAAWCEPALLSESQNFYRRGDNTFTYFFTVKEMQDHATALGLEGSVEMIEVHGQNRRTGVQLHRRFLQARWTKKPKKVEASS